jgi:TRAP transporter TAXI family solute receptor
MKRLKSIFCLFLIAAIVFVLVGSATTAQAQQQKIRVKAFLSTFGASAYHIGFAMGELMKKEHPWLQIAPSETPGGIYNVKAFIKNPGLWDDTIIISTYLNNALARKGNPIFEGKINLKGLFNYTAVAIHLVTMNRKIKTPADLKGKRIGLGLKGQITWGFIVAGILEHGYGITEANSRLEYLGPGAAKTALLDGRVDAAVTGMYMNPYKKLYTPAPHLLELASGPRSIYHLSWGKQELLKAGKALGFPIVMETVPAGALKTLKEDVNMFLEFTNFVCKDIFPEEYAYEIVKFAIQHGNKFAEYHAIGKMISPKLMPYGFTKMSLHPGALRAYEEAGISVPPK